MEALAVIIPIAIVAGTIFVIMKVARQASEQYGFRYDPKLDVSRLSCFP